MKEVMMKGDGSSSEGSSKMFMLTLRGNLVWNLLQNLYEGRLIIQGRSIFFMFFDILAYLYE